MTKKAVPPTCTHLAVAEVAGVDPSDVVAACGARPLDDPTKSAYLASQGWITVCMPLEMDLEDVAEVAIETEEKYVFMVGVPSLNVPGYLHVVVVWCDANGLRVVDPTPPTRRRWTGEMVLSRGCVVSITACYRIEDTLALARAESEGYELPGEIAHRLEG